MKYDLTDKLKFNEDPKLQIGKTELTVNSDAEVVLQLMSVYEGGSSIAAASAAAELLFSEKDRKKLQDLHLKVEDYITTIQTALTLAMGSDPDEEAPEGN